MASPEQLEIEADNVRALTNCRRHASFDIILTADGDFLLTGWGHPIDLNFPDLWLLKADPTGTKVWETFIAGSESEAGGGLLEIAAGEYAVAGFTGSFDTGELDGTALR